MNRIRELVATEKVQYLVFISLSFCILGFTLILYFTKTESFQRFFGNISPLIIIPLAIVLGFVFLTYLLSQEYFEIFRKENLNKLPMLSLFAIVFASGAILVDLFFSYPEDINVLLPKSLFFYPIMGYVVEILFHIIPLSILIGILTIIFKNVGLDKIIFFCIILVSVLESVYQYAFDSSVGRPIWVYILDGIRLFLFGLTQLYIFKRYDFVSMFSFRMIYYLLWHIVWGTMRLNIIY